MRFKWFVFLVSVSLMMSYLGDFFLTCAENVEEPHSKTYCFATVDDAFVDNEILIVVFPEFNSKNYVAADFSTIDCIEIEELSNNVEEGTLGRILKLTIQEHSKRKVLDAICVLEKREDIYSAEPNYLGNVEMDQSDSVYSSNDQWAISKLSLQSAWNIETGSSEVKVGIIDGGIDPTHPDLVGRVDTDLSRSFTDYPENALQDNTGHGTHLAGIIGARGDNQVGITGVCGDVTLVSLRVGSGAGEMNAADMIEAIEYADDVGIQILNCSLGTIQYAAISEVCVIAILNYDGLLVCSAGNFNGDNNTGGHYPSNHRLPNLIAVGASTELDRKRLSSNYGSITVDIFAPGDSILSCVPLNMCNPSDGDCVATTHDSYGYHKFGGTSMASAYVAGVAALMLAANPSLEAYQLKDILMDSVDVVYDEDGNNVFGDLCVSGGRLNAYNAVYSAKYDYHPHDYYYVDDYCHSYNCETCDYSAIEESHVFDRAEHVGHYNEHAEVCECGYVALGWHNFNICVTSSVFNQHHLYCRCGYSVMNYHVYVAAEADASYNWICRDCGKTSDSVTMPTPQSLVSGDGVMTMSAFGSYTLSDGTTLQILTESGSYVLSNGMIVLSDEDAALADAGLLDPYELVESVSTPVGPGHEVE